MPHIVTRLSVTVLAFSVLAISDSSGQVPGDNVIHDPSRIIEEDGRYYVYYTPQNFANGIWLKWSDDLVTWHDPIGGSATHAIFSTAPPWVPVEKPNSHGTFWAPSILKHGNEYRLYYSVSTIFTQESAIGLATNTTLDYLDPNYQWVDQGIAIESEVGHPYNTIDPSVFVDTENKLWMVFGSYWEGIHITELDPSTGKPFDASPAGATRIATRSEGTDIEAPYIHYRDGYYYLFANWGSCCSGVDSTYNIRIGRGTSPTGPFYDKDWIDLRDGGGSLFLEAEGDLIGPGHAGIYSEGGEDYFGYHFYDASSNGLPRYELDTLLWESDGWPLLRSEAFKADLNQDSLLNTRDWQRFLLYNQSDLSGLSPAEQVGRGDLDGDGDNDYHDFKLFKRYYVALHGPEALASLADFTVPEPTGLVLALTGVAALLVGRRDRVHDLAA